MGFSFLIPISFSTERTRTLKRLQGKVFDNEDTTSDNQLGAPVSASRVVTLPPKLGRTSGMKYQGELTPWRASSSRTEELLKFKKIPIPSGTQSAAGSDSQGNNKKQLPSLYPCLIC